MSLVRTTLIATVSLGISVGILLHDTHVDAATAALALPAVHMSYETSVKQAISSPEHTHVERVSVAQFVRGLKSTTPRITPRNDERKYHIQRRTSRGRHAFDDYYLPFAR